ncbi:hypothetical protein C0J52_03748 [Blattella germanica]|nr:hypothetical protein C0J52_03748 [Blattella germanica]
MTNMALWTDVHIGFDGDEETVNFGARAVSENEKAIFETCTLATVQPNGRVVKNPRVLAASYVSGRVCLAIDTTLIVFKDETCTEKLFVHTFQSAIDCFTVAKEVSIIFVVTGKVVECIHYTLDGQILTSSVDLPVENNIDFAAVNIVISTVKDGIYNIFVIGNEGEIFSLLICHSVDGNLYTMCLHTFMYLSTWDEMPVEDLIVLNEESVTEQTYLLLLSNLNEDDKRCIQLVAFPSFEKIFNISVSPSTFLVSMMSYSQEVLFVEGSKNSNLEFIQSFCIKNITESQPLERLQRLLRRRKFEEAEKFAKIFNLNVEIVFKEEVKHYMELLQPWSVSRGEGVDAANLNKFIELLSKIHDIEFVCEVCMNVVTTDLTKTQQVLDYARDRLKKEDNKHWYNYKSRLTEETILELLNAIPLDLKPVDLLPWLFHFISSVLSTVPKLMNQIISWIIRAIKTMEIDWRSWPDSGLNFAKEILQIAKVHQDSRIDNCSIYKWQSATNVYLKELVNLIDILHDLKQLKDKHKIRVTLADFTQRSTKQKKKLIYFFKFKLFCLCLFFHMTLELCFQDNKNEVTRILLGKVAPMNIKLLMTDFLNNFMFKNGLVAHVVLSKCIHGILNCSENWWYHNEQAPWEETVAAQQMYYVHELYLAVDPFHYRIVQLYRLDHPLVKLIRHEYKMMEIKIVQKKYGLTKLSVENCNLYSLIRAIKLIFKAGQEGMLEDALKFASISTKMTEEAYILCIEHYLEMGNQRKALELLDSLKPDMFVKSCERLVFRAQSFLQSKRQIDVSNAYFEILDSLATRAKKFSLTKDKNSPIIDLPIEEIHNIYLIYKQFGKRISLKDYCWDHSRLKVLSECVEELIESNGDIFDIYYNVAHISRLLQFPPCEGILEMIKHSLKKKNMTLTLNIMSISNANAGPEQAYAIARGACTYWTDDSFFYWLDLLSWTRSVQYLTAQGGENDGDGLNVFQTAAQENLKRWRFTPLYTDPFIFSNSNRVMRFLKDSQELFLRIEPVACDSVKALLLKVVSARQLDIDLGLGLLHFLNNAMAKDCLDEMLEIFKEDYQKLSNVAELAVLFLKYEGYHVNKFQTIFTRCKWAKKFGQLKIHCKDIFVNSPDQKINLLKEMMHLKQVDIFMILEYCFDFELDPQDCIKLYLRILLTDWEPSFEIEKSVDGEQLHVQEVDSETDKKCNDILKLIKNKDQLIIELNQIVADVNYYYYEMFIYIISLLEKLLPNENFMSKKVLLLFLKKYKRVENPKQQELAKWHHKFPNASRSPVLSKWRVPFSVFLMKEPWVVLKEELRLNTYKQWLTVSNTLNIHTDAICSTTIQESINSRYNSNMEMPTEAWNVHSQDSLFLSQIEECVKLISDLKMASACMHLVMNNTPPGADQVKAADLCYKYTLEWSQTTEEPYASEYIKRIHKKYLDLKTTHILHKYGLGEASYLGLVAKPRDLITTPVQQSIMDDETCDLTRLISLPNNNASIEEDNLLRVYYLLKCDDENSLASYLVNLAFKLDTNVNIPMESQLRALQCLLTLISDDALEDLTGKTTEEIGEIMKNLTYARTLEMLGFNYSVSNFENFNKLELVKSIWTARRKDEEACIHSLVLIQSCPVLRSINMEVIIEHSLQMVYPHLAAVLLLFLNEEESNIQKQKILKMMDKVEIIQKLKHLISKGVSIAEKAISFLESDGNPKVNGCP